MPGTLPVPEQQQQQQRMPSPSSWRHHHSSSSRSVARQHRPMARARSLSSFNASPFEEPDASAGQRNSGGRSLAAVVPDDPNATSSSSFSSAAPVHASPAGAKVCAGATALDSETLQPAASPALLPSHSPHLSRVSELDRSEVSSAVVSAVDHATYPQLGGSSSGLGATVKRANHHAIVRRFQLRRVSEDDETHAMAHAHGSSVGGVASVLAGGESDTSTEGSPRVSLFQQRFVKAAAIREVRKMHNQHNQQHQQHSHHSHQQQHPCALLGRWLMNGSRRLWRGLLAVVSTPFSPFGRVSQLRAAVGAATALLQAVYLPLGPVYVPRGNAATRWLNVAVDVVYALDFVVACNTAEVVRGHELETSRRRLLARRVRSGAFFVDLAASLPLDLLLHDAQIEPLAEAKGDEAEHATLAAWGVLGESLTPTRFVRWLALLRVLWLARVVRATTRWTYPRRRRQLIALRITLLLVLVTHYVACGWRWLLLLLVEQEHEEELLRGSVWRRYVADLRVAVPLLLSQAAPPVPASPASSTLSVFGAVVGLLGCVVVAVVVADVALLVHGAERTSAAFRSKLERVAATMDALQLPPPLRRRIHEYFDHLWFEHRTLDGDLAWFTRELSHSLGLEVQLYRYMDLVLHVPFWRNCSADFVTQLMLRLEVRVYLPEDFIMREGEIGTELFLINRGVCELRSSPMAIPAVEPHAAATRTSFSAATTTLSSDSYRRPSHGQSSAAATVHRNVRRLLPGHAFGEPALLMNYKRMATVRALSFVEMCVLQRRAFQEILVRYRDDRVEVLREMIFSCIEKKEQRFIPFPWEALVDQALADRQGAAGPTHTRLTPWEAANVLVDIINPTDLPDDSIVFGFRDVDDSALGAMLRPATKAPPTQLVETRLAAIEAMQRETLERLQAMEARLRTDHTTRSS